MTRRAASSAGLLAARCGSFAAFEPAARCELVDIGGEPGFDRQSFYMLCVQHARKYS